MELSEEQVKLMQTQDKRYITARRVMETKKIERLQEGLQRLEEVPANKHTFFVDDEKEVKRFNLAKRLDTPAPLLSRRYNRPKTSDLQTVKLDMDVETVVACSKLRRKAYKELDKRAERQKKLLTLERKMEIKGVLQVMLYSK